MDIAEEAFIHQRRDKAQDAIIAFKKAAKFEIEAANILSIAKNNEPTRSILYRSAASLAFNAKEYDLAERMIANGLAGYPPFEIREELKNLFEDVTFSRHLSAKGLKLNEDNWMMSLHGNATKYGGTAANQLMMRVDKVSKLFYRTVERLRKQPYRSHGGVSKDIKDSYGLYIEAFNARSFAVTFKIGTPDPQMELWPGSKTTDSIKSSEIVGEILDCFEMFEGEQHNELQSRINDSTYYDNFVALAKEIAPDGDEIKVVGFTSVIDGEEKPVPLRKKRKGIGNTISEGDVVDAPKNITHHTEISGILQHADSIGKKTHGVVQLLGDDGKKQKIYVPIAIMKDVVQPFYEEEVTIQAHIDGKKTILDEISLKK